MDITYPIRINSYLAKCGITTRKEADEFISKGYVFINGKKAVLGDKVNEDDKVELKNKAQKQYFYFAYNKPIGIVTTGAQKGEQDILRTTRFPEKVFPVGRLDKDSHGLILMTNDGRITDRLLRPDFPHEKEYVVKTDTPYNDAFLPKLSGGIRFDDYTTKPAKTKRLTKNTFSIILTEGKKRQIRRMVALFRHTVRDLKRIRIMNINLGTLPEATYRKIEGKELKAFLSSLGLE